MQNPPDRGPPWPAFHPLLGRFCLRAPFLACDLGAKRRRQEGSARVGPGKFLRRRTWRAHAWGLHRKKFQGALALTSAGARLVPLRALARFALQGRNEVVKGNIYVATGDSRSLLAA